MHDIFINIAGHWTLDSKQIRQEHMDLIGCSILSLSQETLNLIVQDHPLRSQQQSCTGVLET